MEAAEQIEAPGATLDETPVVSRHRIELDGRTLDYSAAAGHVVVRDDDGAPLTSVFYLAYTVNTPKGETPRPLTFLFNGGPGSASLWLNIGGFGPKRAPTATPHATPPAPYAVGDNPHSLLAFSDLVFIDAPGTGYSRLFPGVPESRVYGVDQDVDAFARAITRYLTLTGRWNAPRFLFGESYGTTRAAGLVHALQNRGLDFNGVVLLSTILNWAENHMGGDQGYVNMVPSFAATAHFHGRGRTGAESLDELLDLAREFARSDYARALQFGDRLDAAEERRVADRLSELIGLDAEYLLRAKLRVGMEQYRYALLEDEGRVVGRFDTRFVADHQYVVGNGSHDPATDDAATAGVNSAHLSTFRAHVTDDLGFRSDLHYRHLHNMPIAGAWDWHHKAPGIDEPMLAPNMALDLSAALRRNPALQVAVLGGVFDLATPFYATEHDVAHLYLAPALRENIRFSFYESGHMTFVDETVIPRMTADLRAFYAEAAPAR